jgi:hypothetical protein
MAKASAHAAVVPRLAENRSIVNAKATFKNFSLSKLATAKPTRNYIAKGEDVRAKQKSLIKRQLDELPPHTGPGLTLIISDQSALEVKEGKLDLSTLIDAMDKAKEGTQFYTSGTSVAEQIDVQNQIDDFFTTLKGMTNARPE